jgi:hypothetical protein
MGLAFKSGGMLLGPIVMLIIALMNFHCQHLLVLGIKNVVYLPITV